MYNMLIQKFNLLKIQFNQEHQITLCRNQKERKKKITNRFYSDLLFHNSYIQIFSYTSQDFNTTSLL